MWSFKCTSYIHSVIDTFIGLDITSQNSSTTNVEVTTRSDKSIGLYKGHGHVFDIDGDEKDGSVLYHVIMSCTKIMIVTI